MRVAYACPATLATAFATQCARLERPASSVLRDLMSDFATVAVQKPALIANEPALAANDKMIPKLVELSVARRNAFVAACQLCRTKQSVVIRTLIRQFIAVMEAAA